MPKKSSRAPLSLDHLERLDRPTRERIYQRIQQEEAVERARALESQGWRPWYAEMFGEDFVAVLAPHHVEAIEWHWNSLILKRAGLDITRYAYFAIWPRGHMKSTIARYIAVCDAALSTSGYCLYVSG